MNGIKCPNCNLVNMLSANVCHRCQTSLTELPQTAEVSVPIEQTFEAQSVVRQTFQTPNESAVEISPDNELGNKTYFWYRVYLIVMTLIYLAVIGLGVFVTYFAQFETNPEEAAEMYIMGIAYAIIGFPFAVIFLIGIFLPRKSWNWVVGIVYIAIGMTSCCFLPATIPLLIYWLKPETKAVFGRK